MWLFNNLYKSAKSEFLQFLIYMEYFWNTFPLISALIKSSRKKDYKIFLNSLSMRDIMLRESYIWFWNWNLLRSFEILSVKISGSLFHIGQYNLRQIWQKKPIKTYKTNNEFFSKKRSFFGLSFVSVQNLCSYFWN